MKHFALVLIALTLSGCYRYGTGEAIEYPYAVEDGMFWMKVWAKTDLESSESDCFIFSDTSLKAQFQDAIEKKQKIRMNYNRHFVVLADCLPDEVNSIEPL